MSRLIFPLLVPALLALLCQCASPSRHAGTVAPAASDRARWARVTNRLAQATPTDARGRPVGWDFSLRHAHGINARSWPGGRVEVNAGTLTFVENDSELAAILAHEMAHVTSGHHRRQIVESWTNLLAGAALAAILTHQGTDHGPAAALGIGAVLSVNVTALAARRRTREAEADRLSLDLLRLAGYPPLAAVDFWERYATARAAGGRQSGRWWQSHPADSIRISRLRQMATTR